MLRSLRDCAKAEKTGTVPGNLGLSRTSDLTGLLGSQNLSSYDRIGGFLGSILNFPVLVESFYFKIKDLEIQGLLNHEKKLKTLGLWD